MKKSILLLLGLFSCVLSFAQNELLIQNNQRLGLHLLHTVQPKESFYSISRLYAVPPKDIAAANELELETGLNIGQVLQIPLMEPRNFSQSAPKGRPVYYVVGEKEGLYRVTTKNGAVTMADLRKWNNLTGDNIAVGQKLIVGYLTSAEADKIVVTTPPPPAEITTIANTEKEEPVRTNTTTTNDTSTTIDQSRGTSSVTPPPQPPPPASQKAVNDGAGGYFRTDFHQQVKSQPLSKEHTVTSGIFKTSSGWQDTKYYALIDNVEPGTIIRITNPTTNKSVYAKVLDQMAGIRQNQGLDIRISNAAATILEISDVDKFIVKVQY
jgi:LysM repeat protein